MQNSPFTENQLLKSVKQLFRVTEKLIEDQKEISNVTTIDCKELTWSATSVLCDKAFEITNAKTYVFADSVLCLGSMRDEPIEAWKNKIKWYLENYYLKDLNRIDGESMEFEWKIFPGFTTLDILEEIPKFMKDLQCEPEQFKDRIIFMSMYNDIVWGEQGNTEKCENNSVTVANYARRFPRGRWSFLGPGSEKKWYGTYSDKPDGDWDETAERMMLIFSCSSHLKFRATNALERGEELRSKEKGKKSIHFNGSEENSEFILRTVISANQLRNCGAVADLCKELSKDSGASGKPDAHEYLETMEIPTEPPIVDPHTDAEP